jgi:hypothetical protein
MLHTDTADARLNTLLTAIQRRWGQDAVQPLARLSRHKPGLLTGFSELDAHLAPGGIPLGAVTLLASIPTAGMLTLAYRTVGLAQGMDAHVLYIDQAGTFDAAYAASLGVDLARLFLIRPETPLEALDLARDLLRTEPIGALVLDVGCTLPDREGLRRLGTALAKRGPALLVVCWLKHPSDSHQMARLPAGLRLWVERVGWLHECGDVAGCRVRVSRLSSGERECLAEFDVRFGSGERGR